MWIMFIMIGFKFPLTYVDTKIIERAKVVCKEDYGTKIKYLIRRDYHDYKVICY